MQVNFTWATANATGVSITIDGGATQSFGPNGSAALPFNCAGNAHSYALTAQGANNQTANRTITLHAHVAAAADHHGAAGHHHDVEALIGPSPGGGLEAFEAR